MKVVVREHMDDGTAEIAWPPINNARVSIVSGGTKVDDSTTSPAITGTDGIAEITAFKFRVDAEGFARYEGVYLRPNLQAPPLPVSLRRL